MNDQAAQLARAREALLHLYALSDGPATVLGAICLHGLGRDDEIPAKAIGRALLPPAPHEAGGDL